MMFVQQGTLAATRLAMLAVGAAVATESVAVAHRSPAYSFAGTSGWAVGLELTVGGALIIAAARWLADAALRSFALLLFATALCWLIVEWNNPGIRSSTAFTLGLVLYPVAVAFVVHAALHYTGQLNMAERIVVGTGYVVTIGVGGVAPALAFDPHRESCSECPANLLTVGDAPELVDRLTRVSLYALIAWLPLVLVFLAIRLVRLTAPRRRLVAPVLVAAAGYACLVGLDYLHALGRGFLATDSLDRKYWLAEGGLLIALAAASGWPLVARRMTRSAIARLVVQAGSAPRPGALSVSLGAALGDDAMRLLYPLRDGRLIDGDGHVVSLDGGRPRTALLRGETTVALLEHRPGLLDDSSAVSEVADAAGLALDGERLQAERQVQLADLRESRARIVAAADAERRRLERDLHDGAQQQLVALALALQLEQLRTPDSDSAARLEQVRAAVTAGLADLRAVAHGLYPAELADEGLAAALDVLRDSSPGPVHVTTSIGERPPASVESAAYYAAVRCLSGPSSIAATRHDGVLRLDIHTPRVPQDLVAVQDRVGALNGLVSVDTSDPSSCRVRVELPCAS